MFSSGFYSIVCDQKYFLLHILNFHGEYGVKNENKIHVHMLIDIQPFDKIDCSPRTSEIQTGVQPQIAPPPFLRKAGPVLDFGPLFKEKCIYKISIAIFSYETRLGIQVQLYQKNI